MLWEYLRLRQVLGDASPIVFSFDDGLGKKYEDTRHLAGVTYHHDHNASSPYRQVYSNGYLYVEGHILRGILSSPSAPSCTCEKRLSANSTVNVNPATA
jgi:hypothetical protein